MVSTMLRTGDRFAPPTRVRRRWILGFAWAIACLGLMNRADAGLGPENVFFVVNGDDADSLTIANHYVSLRQIPPGNVMVMTDVPSGLTVSLEDFRERILRPILSEIDRRKLSAHIRAITYSAGFPTGVKINSHTAKLTDPSAKKYQTPVASLNSLTFFYRFVLADSHEYLGWGANLYARGLFQRHFVNPLSGEKGQSFQAALDDDKAGRYAEAAAKWDELTKALPSMPGVEILAAESHWQAGNRNEAVRHLGMAVKAGWQNRRYLKDGSPLSTLLEGQTASGNGSLSSLLAACADVPDTHQGPIGFAGDVGWAANGYPVPIKDGGMSYMLSSVLAVIHPNGSSIDQAVNYLTSSAASDRTFPDGTVGFSKTSDVRTSTRFPVYADALSWLLARDRDVGIFTRTLPSDSEAYVGLMLGTAKFDVNGRRWSLVPGSIAENLTSTGAVFASRSQTKLTELLHAGACMSSGAVTEPFSIPMKFPSPMIHPYYYEGTSAIEAFYLTVSSPYQLLIVGDPLTQPFARVPADEVTITLDAEPTEDNKRVIRVTRSDPAEASTDRHTPARVMELYLQDRLVQRIRPVGEIKLQIPANTFGPVRCRAVLIGSHPTEPRIGYAGEFVFGPVDKLPIIRKLEAMSNEESLTLDVRCVGAERIELQHLGRTVATIEGDQGSTKLTLDQTGQGPLRLQAIGYKGERTLIGPMETFAR